MADVFEVAAGQLTRFDPALGSERAWLFGIATTLLRRHRRTEERRLRSRLHRIRRRLAEAVGRPTDRNQDVTVTLVS